MRFKNVKIQLVSKTKSEWIISDCSNYL